MENILLDLWGTMGHLEPGEDFGEAIANALRITKQEYLQYVKKYWFKYNLSSEEFAKLMLTETGRAKKSILPNIIGWIEEPIKRARLYPEVNGVLRELRNKKNLYLVSDTGSIGRSILNKFEILPYFTKVFLSNEFGKTKTEGLYEIVLKEINQKPINCLVVGDSLESDYNIPIALGCNTVLIDREGKHPNYKSIKTLEELK